ncbi:FixH family protein [Pontixanthobacter aquaemixtae]|uniref:Nitrogen fixation protein FixH n=1 Tax=Pontixanthobacter aquaemixtae TaxID=1958940 RepID=A0A844ZPK1_9SPHN|nr:FixH family protein [Pontixanthobacter aquaemixtae]MXO89272.1 hypothetical protein [Pontixanthobacter aquaemixtae]
MTRKFTGRHFAIIMVVGFGIVVAVNLFMATLATRGFGGVVVENSYVASQKFNGWLKAAREQEKLGWTIEPSRDAEGRLAVRTQAVPATARVRVDIRRPLGQPEQAAFELVRESDGMWRSPEPLAEGRWLTRLYVEAGDDRWANEVMIP